MRDRFQIKCYFLLALGLMQMLADLCGWQTVKAIAAASGASPAPKVFSSVKGLETFSSEFSIEWTDMFGQDQVLAFTPSEYEKILGPYNRRNVYGAALAYGPVLQSDKITKAMFKSVCKYAFCGKAPLLKELSLDPNSIKFPVKIRLQPKVGTNPDPALPFEYLETCE